MLLNITHQKIKQYLVADEKRYFFSAVRPDPPVSLNWTLLNMSFTSAYYDIILNWEPPQSADVEMGWMRLQYEIQYRDVNSDQWEVVSILKMISLSSVKLSHWDTIQVCTACNNCILFTSPQVDPVKTTHRSLYGLQTNVNHEVRVRCKMSGGKEFGGFSDSVFVHIPSKGKYSVHCLQAAVKKGASLFSCTLNLKRLLLNDPEYLKEPLNNAASISFHRPSRVWIIALEKIFLYCLDGFF